MTYIFNVFTDARRGATLTGNVQYRDRDNYGFSQGPVFGLQLIMDALEEGFGAGPVSAATEAEFKELFELDSGRKAAEFARRTAEIIVSWEIREDSPADLDQMEGASASFTLEVSDPRYLEHLNKNTSFQTVFTGHLPS